MRVILYTSISSGVIPVSTSNPLPVAGTIASGATDSGNPVKVGGVYNAVAPTLTDGQRGDLQLTVGGRLNVDAGTVMVTGTIISMPDRMVRVQYNVEVLGGQASGETDITVNGLTKLIIFDVPALKGGAGTASLFVQDVDNKNIYSYETKAESSENVTAVDRPLEGTTTLKITTDIAQDDNTQFTVTIWYQSY